MGQALYRTIAGVSGVHYISADLADVSVPITGSVYSSAYPGIGGRLNLPHGVENHSFHDIS